MQVRRFPPATRRYYNRTEAFSVRADCPAGVVLDLETDSDLLQLTAIVGAGARGVAYFDLYVDGCFTGMIGDTSPGEMISGEVRWARPSTGLSHVTLYLPQSRTVLLQRIAVADGATLRPAQPAPYLLALGDSITQGMDGVHPSLTYPAVAARELGLSLYNCGIGGHTFDADSIPDRPVPEPALITVAFGVNDWGLKRDVTAAHSFLTRLRAWYPVSPVFVLEPIWSAQLDPEPGDGYPLAAYRHDLTAIAAKFPGVSCLPSVALFPTGNTLLCDGVHPNTEGHIVYGRNLAELLRAYSRAGVPVW